MKTSELTGDALDWAVAKCEGVINGDDLDVGFILERGYSPSSDWAQGGAIIERERICLENAAGMYWIATMLYQNDDDERTQTSEEQGATPLIAAMRCYVASKLGDEVEINELVTNNGG